MTAPRGQDRVQKEGFFGVLRGVLTIITRDPVVPPPTAPRIAWSSGSPVTLQALYYFPLEGEAAHSARAGHAVPAHVAAGAAVWIIEGQIGADSIAQSGATVAVCLLAVRLPGPLEVRVGVSSSPRSAPAKTPDCWLSCSCATIGTIVGGTVGLVYRMRPTPVDFRRWAAGSGIAGLCAARA